MNNIKNNKVCQICGTPYYACSKCNEINSWKAVVDKPDCFKFYLILTELNQSIITEKEAAREFRNLELNLTNLRKRKIEFVEPVYRRLYDILKNNKA